MKYRYLNDFPLNIASGGKEEQLRQVAEYARCVFGNALPLEAENKLEKGGVLHCFGDSPHFYHLSRFLQGQGLDQRLIINPNFYRRSPINYFPQRILSFAGPNWWSERKKMYESCSTIIVNSEFEKSYLIRIFGRSLRDRCKVIFNTFNIDSIETTPSEEHTNLPDRYFSCLTQISERKNIFNLIRAASIFYRKTGLPLVLIGGTRFASKKSLTLFYKLLEDQAGAVIWLGQVTKSVGLRIVHKSCAHVLPSFIESPGISNLEALALGKRIVVGDFPVPSETFIINEIRALKQAGHKIVVICFNLLDEQVAQRLDIEVCQVKDATRLQASAAIAKSVTNLAGVLFVKRA